MSTITTKTPIIKGDNFSHTWGIRRADGQPWRTEPSKPGAHDYYAAGEEVSNDGMVMGCNDDVLDVLARMLSQESDKGVPHPGRATVVKARFQRNPDGRGWGYWYEDVPRGSLLNEVASVAARAVRLLSEVASRVAPDAPQGVQP